MEEAQRRAEEGQQRAEEAHQRIVEEVRASEESVRAADERRRRTEALQREAEERRRAEEDKEGAEEERRKAEEAKRRADEERRKAEEQQRLAEEQRRQAEEERGAAEEQQRKAEEERRRAEEDKARADEEARIVNEVRERAEQEKEGSDKKAAEAEAAREEAERNLREGKRPVVIPTPEEIAEVKRRLQYTEGMFHFAAAGVSGSGKSSLINALRGMHNKDSGAAPTGVTETTSVVTRYPDLDPRNPFVWYDVLSAGTLETPDWVYFSVQGLYIFDCIIVLFDNRFTETDIAILRNCERFNIPAYIVRSKSNQHIRNILTDMGYDSEDDDSATRRTLMESARKKYIEETRASVTRNLEEAELAPRRVYIVSKDTMVKVTREGKAKDALDEVDLIEDLLAEALERRDTGKPKAAEAEAAREEAERDLREGKRPVVIPTPEEIAEVKRRLQYTEGMFHFAVAGVSGSGKSSLINALRGMRNKDGGAAPTGVTETTSVVTRYPDLDPRNPFVWYDVPGAGTLGIPDWVYFNAQGLYIFDCIIVLFDNRFTETDIAILRNCERFNIPAYIVRSKSNQHIRNILTDMGYDSEDDDSTTRHTLTETARKKYIEETRASVARNLEDAELAPHRVYIVSKDTMVKVTKGKKAKDALDEADLIEDLLAEALARRDTGA
ncbi:nucleoside triphosphate hydrolase protein [Wolfiporia cocos MD-104 SS10]|uniref:Nucleoside triphosphate hydrolase protein n=1 Tax=Wolfiporia cocos (strain MD-104) TaxID=742152 RepID=A0A2H3J624_WOLCO|nr:nucleoside triphosphate hydrolase protein [Wolfiporia cocos MD-104 SS10]